MFVTVNVTQEIQSTNYKYIYMNASLHTLAAPFLKLMYIYTFHTWLNASTINYFSDEKEAWVFKKNDGKRGR